MKDNVFYKKIFRDVLNTKFDEIMMYKDCFRDEIQHTDFNDYENDMLDDCLVMLRKLNDVYTHDNYLDESMAIRIMKWCEAVDELLFDVRSYLIKDCNVYPRDVIENYKKEGK